MHSSLLRSLELLLVYGCSSILPALVWTGSSAMRASGIKINIHELKVRPLTDPRSFTEDYPIITDPISYTDLKLSASKIPQSLLLLLRYHYEPFTCQEIELPKAALSSNKIKSQASQQPDFCLKSWKTTASSPALHQFRLERDLSISSELKNPKPSNLEEPHISYVLISYPVLPLNHTPGHVFDLGQERIATRSLLR